MTIACSSVVLGDQQCVAPAGVLLLLLLWCAAAGDMVPLLSLLGACSECQYGMQPNQAAVKLLQRSKRYCAGNAAGGDADWLCYGLAQQLTTAIACYLNFFHSAAFASLPP